MNKKLKKDLTGKVTFVLDHLDHLHERFYLSDTFNGPSLYFHRKALSASNVEDKSESIYAALVSWGMHRMGPKGSKMCDFEVFCQSLKMNIEKCTELHSIEFSEMSVENWKTLEKVFKTIKIMASKTSLVGNSKVLAHLLPDLVAPADRQYTLQYLFGNKNIKNNLNCEWLLFRKIHEQFYYPLIREQILKKKRKYG